MPLDAQTISEALGGKRYGNGYRSACPVCGGSGKSIKFTMTDASDRVLIHCFGGCDFVDLTAELRSRGLWSDTSPEQREQFQQRRRSNDTEEAKIWLMIADSALDRGETLSARDRQKLAVLRQVVKGTE